jgi:hypothetical protein
VTGGRNNTAAGHFSSVSGGGFNSAAGLAASVSGGSSNTAGVYGSVTGGSWNKATFSGSGVSGGTNNTASGQTAVSAAETDALCLRIISGVSACPARPAIQHFKTNFLGRGAGRSGTASPRLCAIRSLDRLELRRGGTHEEVKHVRCRACDATPIQRSNLRFIHLRVVDNLHTQA